MAKSNGDTIRDIDEIPLDRILAHDKIDIIVSNTVLKDILLRSSYTIDEDGFLKEPNGEIVMANDERELHIDDLGAIGSGSKIFIRKNLASFSDYLSQTGRY